MLETKPKSLATNINKTNTNHENEVHGCSPPVHAFEQVLTYPDNSSLTKFLEDFQAMGLNDENYISPSSFQGVNDLAPNEPETEIALLKAELEATRSKLAQYEAVVPPQPFPSGPTGGSSSECPVSDGFPWSDTTCSDLYPGSSPLPVPVPTPVPPLRLPATPTTFQAPAQPTTFSQRIPHLVCTLT